MLISCERLRALMPEFYSPVSSLHHYLHMAQGNYKSYLRAKQVRIKKYFYVLRPIFACMWIETEKTAPPMEFEKLLDSQSINRNLSNEIQKLLNRKRVGAELGIGDRIKIIDDFLIEKLSYFEEYSRKLKIRRNFNVKLLDSLFREQVSKE